MTLIASCSLAGHPVLLGDLLISQWCEDPAADVWFNVPTHSDANSVVPRDFGHLVVRLRQKVNIVDDNLAVAWSGNELAARVACRELLTSAQIAPLTIERLKSTLHGLALGKLELGLLGLLVVEVAAGRRACFRFAWESGKWIEPTVLDHSGAPVYAHGSGSDHFVEVLKSAWGHLAIPATYPPEGAAILGAANIVGVLSGEQMRASRGLADAQMYGGGFEIATVQNGRVTKAEGVTYYFLDALRTQDGRCLARFRRAISYEYEGDLLLVSTLELQWGCGWVYDGEVRQVEIDAEIRGQPSTYVILPVHRDLGAGERGSIEGRRTRPRFKSPYTVLYVHLPQQGGSVRSIVHYAGPAEPAIGFDLDAHEAVVSINRELLNKIARHL